MKLISSDLVASRYVSVYEFKRPLLWYIKIFRHFLRSRTASFFFFHEFNRFLAFGPWQNGLKWVSITEAEGITIRERFSIAYTKWLFLPYVVCHRKGGGNRSSTTVFSFAFSLSLSHPPPTRLPQFHPREPIFIDHPRRHRSVHFLFSRVRRVSTFSWNH